MSLRTRRQERVRQPVIADINLSPLIDMVFILLIFFVVTAVFVKESAIEVERPAARHAASPENRSLLLTVDGAGQLYFEDIVVTLDGIGLIMRRLNSDGLRPVLIVADRRVTADRLVAVIDAVRAAGTESISIATGTERNAR